MSAWTSFAASAEPPTHEAVVVGTLVAAVAVAAIVHQALRPSIELPVGTILPPHLTSWIPYLGSAVEMGAGIWHLA